MSEVCNILVPFPHSTSDHELLLSLNYAGEDIDGRTGLHFDNASLLLSHFGT
jgi:hypothetical protein